MHDNEWERDPVTVPDEEHWEEETGMEDPPPSDYTRLLEDTFQTLEGVSLKLHDWMMAHTAGEDQWKEGFILNGHIYALMETIRLYQRHAYPPWEDAKE